MRERGYDHFTQHKNEHERLLDEIRDIMDDFEASSRFDDRLLGGRAGRLVLPAFRNP